MVVPRDMSMSLSGDRAPTMASLLVRTTFPSSFDILGRVRVIFLQRNMSSSVPSTPAAMITFFALMPGQRLSFRVGSLTLRSYMPSSPGMMLVTFRFGRIVTPELFRQVEIVLIQGVLGAVLAPGKALAAEVAAVAGRAAAAEKGIVPRHFGRAEIDAVLDRARRS